MRLYDSGMYSSIGNGIAAGESYSNEANSHKARSRTVGREAIGQYGTHQGSNR